MGGKGCIMDLGWGKIRENMYPKYDVFMYLYVVFHVF